MGAFVPTYRYSNTPPDHNYLAWTYDPALTSGDTASVGNGIFLLNKIWVPKTISVTNVVLGVGTINGTPVSSQNFVGLFTSAGVLVGVSADQGAAWGSTGVKVAALASGPFTVTGGPGVWVYTCVLQNATTGARFYRAGGAGGAIANAGLAAANGFRAATLLTGQTTITGPITIANAAANISTIWTALS